MTNIINKTTTTHTRSWQFSYYYPKEASSWKSN